MSAAFLVTLIWSLAVCVIFYRTRHSFAYFLRPALKRLDKAFEGVALMVLEQATKRAVEAALTELETAADLALFHADPRLAIELGYEAPRCEVCGDELLRAPTSWNGVDELHHLAPSCAMEQERRERVS